jgi:signal transduction histidine kinase
MIVEGENQNFKVCGEIARTCNHNFGPAIIGAGPELSATKRKYVEEETKKLNAKLALRADELDAANKELEAFNHTVAHDLRQPLNLLSMCCQSIKLLCGDQLNEECADYVQGAYKATLSMDSLIGALLNFSKMGHIEPRREMVDLGMLAHEVSRSLQLASPERQVDFRISDGMVANGAWSTGSSSCPATRRLVLPSAWRWRRGSNPLGPQFPRRRYYL